MIGYPFEKPLPVVVLLRNRRFATVEQIVQDRPPFFMLGRMGTDSPAGSVIGERCEHVNDACSHQLWRLDGRWQENGAAHSMDIMGTAVIAADGATCELLPLPSAAGAKGEKP